MSKQILRMKVIIAEKLTLIDKPPSDQGKNDHFSGIKRVSYTLFSVLFHINTPIGTLWLIFAEFLIHPHIPQVP